MTTRLRPILIVSLFLTALLATPFAAGQDPTYPPARTPQEAGDPPPVPGEDVIAQARGPIHEAFAAPSNMALQPGPVIAKKPPNPIPEVPPDQKPEGDNVQWIPGYWAWDADRKDYLWVSGVWRVPPSGRKWVPGVWNAVEDGYQWSSGFWAPADQEDMQYLPAPPVSLDNGPSSPQPDGDSFYVPGCWMYQSSSYLWQPGYWQAYRPGMIWTPSCYSWTPGGYLFVPGYWDWPLDNRGLLFAPVAFNRPLWLTPGWSYRPLYAVAYPGLLSSLFIGPTGGFYFGNYYGLAYHRLGFRPWFTTFGGAPSPLFSWYRWRNAHNPGWLNGLYTTYRGRFNGTLTRPPLTIHQQNTILNNTVNVQNNIFSSLRMVQPLSQFNSVRLTRLSTAQLNEQRSLAQRFHLFSVQRQSVERQALRAERRSLPLAHLPAAPAVHRSTAGYGSLSGTFIQANPAHTIAQRIGESRIVTQHSTGNVAVLHTPIAPRLATPPHPLPHAARLEHRPITHHNPSPAAHHAPPAPVHHSAPVIVHHAPPGPVHHPAPTHHAPPAAHHSAPPAHHSAPPAHHSAPPAHHSPPPSHRSGHGGGGHGGHHR